VVEPEDTDDDPSILWAVAGVIACIPNVNFMAWIALAMENPSSSRFYIGLAVLYSLPTISAWTGGSDDLIAGTVVLLFNVLHVQLERIAFTEREWAADSIPSGGMKHFLLTLLGTTGQALKEGALSAKEAVALSATKVLTEADRLEARDALLFEKEKARLELQEFEQRLSRRSFDSADSSSSREDRSI